MDCTVPIDHHLPLHLYREGKFATIQILGPPCSLFRAYFAFKESIHLMTVCDLAEYHLEVRSGWVSITENQRPQRLGSREERLQAFCPSLEDY